MNLQDRVVLDSEYDNPNAVLGTITVVYDDLPDTYFVQFDDGTRGCFTSLEIAIAP